MINLKNYQEPDEIIARLSDCMYPDVERVTKEYARYRSDPDRALLGYVHNHHLVGLIGIIWLSECEVELKHISIKAGMRKQGLGKKLIYEFIENHRIERMEVETDKEAVNFYKSIGFQASSLGEKYPGVERYKCVMSCDTIQIKECRSMAHLIGDRIVLREYRASDLDKMRQWVNDPEITNNLSDLFLYPHSVNETESFLTMIMEGKSNIKSFVIADNSSLDYIGQIDLLNIDWKNRCASMAIVIGTKDKLSKGYGSEAISLLQKFAFEELNLNRIELDVYDYNVRAYKCYLKCGFKKEGRMRQKLFRNGQYRDVIKMAILKEDYLR